MLHSRAVLLTVVALAALVVWAYDRLLTIYWVGGFPLEVRLEPVTGRKVVKVWAATLGRREWAEDVRKDIRIVDDFKPVNDFNGWAFTVDVRCSGRDSGLGLQRSYAQYQLLVVKFEYADGESGFQVVEIPDGRSSLSVRIKVP